ncbi:ankyrin-3-like protein, partial [Lates japonicus]
MLRCVYVSTFVILSPTDYQSILAELQSPAALHSNPHFLEPELPITPNPSLAHHQPEPDSPLLADSQPQPLPWSPEIEPGSGESDGPPRSPPRPCELALSFPVFELPDPVPSKVRKPHIALNDQLLLSEEEDRSFHEMELSPRPKSHSFPAMCELDTDLAYSTSSPSLSSVLSITPSSPDRAQMGDTGVQMDAPQWGTGGYGTQGTVCEVEEVRHVQNLAEEQHDLIETVNEVEEGCTSVEAVTVKADIDEKPEVQKVDGGSEERVFEGDRMDNTDGELQLKDEGGLCCSEREICGTSEGEQVAEDQAVARLSPQAWVEALGELQSSESGSNEEEEEEHRDKEITEETCGSLLEEVKQEEGSEEKEEDEEMTEARVQEVLDQVEQAEKDVCSLS